MLNELLGFVVLTSPLWLILILILVCAVIAYVIARQFKTYKVRMVAGVISFLLVFMVPFGDEIVGKIYLSYLCSTKGGYVAYKAVELQADYWNKDGLPKYISESGYVDLKLLPKRFVWRKISEPYINFLIIIEKWRWQLIDKETKDVLGERISYMRHYGWLSHFSIAPNIGEGCRYMGNKEDRLKEQEFYRDIFKPAKLTR